MNIGIILPTRGQERKRFLNQALFYIKRQTLQPKYVQVIDEEPKSDANDITYRYQKGYEHLKNKCDVIFCFEDDDFYSKNYIESMIAEYKILSSPDIFGINHTTYYHIKTNRWTKLIHPGRASTMSTVLKGGLNIDWQHDQRYFIDIHLWKTLKGIAINMPTINIGIKHGEGKCAGKGHNENFPYKNYDADSSFLKSIVGDDFKFYKPSL